jgi:hypothetical protein
MLITSALWLMTLLGFAAIAFDIGHLLLVRNELQNDADAAALAGANCLNKTTATSGADCTSTPSSTLNWSMASTKASTSIGQNKSDSVSLSTGTVQTGYWDINGGTTLKATTLSPVGPCTVTAGVMTSACDKPAVMVSISRASGSNGGSVGTLIATMFGGSAIPVAASAIAVISSPGSVLPGALIPQAINKCMFDLYWDSSTNSPKLATTATLNGVPQVIGQPWKIRIGSSYHYPACDSGQWTSFQINDNSASYVKGLINNGNPTPLNIGDGTYIQPGTKTSLYNELSSEYPTPPGADVSMPVVDYPAGLDGVKSTIPIVAFAGFHIDDIQGGSGKYIEGHFIKGKTSGGSSGIGPYYGTYTPARLAK